MREPPHTPHPTMTPPCPCPPIASCCMTKLQRNYVMTELHSLARCTSICRQARQTWLGFSDSPECCRIRLLQPDVPATYCCWGGGDGRGASSSQTEGGRPSADRTAAAASSRKPRTTGLVGGREGKASVDPVQLRGVLQKYTKNQCWSGRGRGGQ